ncbi:MAG: hypothetical protein V1897_03495 [Pseudomonadota bacterium]
MTNKKILVVIVLVALAAVAFVTYPQIGKEGVYANEITGKVVSANDDTVIVQGYLTGVPDEMKKLVQVEFAITSGTKLVRKTLHLRLDAEGPYIPETTESEGKVADLIPNTRVEMIKSDKNLVGKEKATASEIRYAVMVFPESAYQQNP